MTDPQLITLTTTTPKLTVTALRGLTAPVTTGGFGGWTLVDRPRRKALTVWDGTDPIRENVPLLFDGVKANRSVEDALRRLEQMAQPSADRTEPPVVRVTGAIPHRGVAWVVESLEYDTDPLYSPTRGGYRIRQGVTVHLLEYVAPDRLQAATSAAAQARDKAKPAKTTVYVVKAGDTLATIATAQLGDHTRWTDIADLNGIRDPKSITVGQKLRIPA